MNPRTILMILGCATIASAAGGVFSFEKLRSYAKYLNIDNLSANETGNDLWHGLIRDCKRKVTFACIQKNAYTYLDNAFVERDNITVFDGLTMTKNNLDYGSCPGNVADVNENLVDGRPRGDCDVDKDDEEPEAVEDDRKFEEPETPLEEITNAFRRRATKFLATRDYELQLPEFFFNGATVRVSPREVDESGALLRVDFGQRALENEGRFFKKFRRFIQNKLLMSFLALLLIIKLIKVKFMFVIPFLFGVGTAKKLFLKLLLFLVPAFAHVFKLCSSYYSHGVTKYHHHHHQIAHHHHHVPVPVPVPTYHDDHHYRHPEPDFDGYDYAHPHIQYRKDIEELKEWGIEPYEEPYDKPSRPLDNPPAPPIGAISAPSPLPAPAPAYLNPYNAPQYPQNVRPVYPNKLPVPATSHNLAYSGYLDDAKINRRVGIQQATVAPSVPVAQAAVNPASSPSAQTKTASTKNPYAAYAQPATKQAGYAQVQRNSPASPVEAPQAAKQVASGVTRRTYDDEYFGPIIGRLEDIFNHLRFTDESCRERLVCSMYKNPTIYSPHSNLVSNELSRDPQELSKRNNVNSASSKRFHKYMNAARLGQDGGDCLRTYPCHINTE